MASSSRKDYMQTPQVDDEDDLIDPDEGMCLRSQLAFLFHFITAIAQSP